MDKTEPRPCSLSLPPVALDEQHYHTTAPIIVNLADFKRELPAICQRLYQTLGSQQSEATYQNCLSMDLLEAGVEKVHLEVELPLTYKGVVVSCRRCDMIVELACGGRDLLEFKAVDDITIIHRKQIEYYLHHANIDEGYLINFPHDNGFQNVTDKSFFEYSGIAGITKQFRGLLLDGPILRLRNDPNNREVQIIHIRRTFLYAEEQTAACTVMAVAPPPTTFGITKQGTPCKSCIKQNQFCRLHKSQEKRYEI